MPVGIARMADVDDFPAVLIGSNPLCPFPKPSCWRQQDGHVMVEYDFYWEETFGKSQLIHSYKTCGFNRVRARPSANV